MEKDRCFAIFLIIFFFLLINRPACATPPPGHDPEFSTPTQSTAGGATAQSTTTVVSNPAVLSPAFSTLPVPYDAPPPVTGTAEASFQTLYSTNVQLYNIPLSYAFTESFKIELTVPYVAKKLKGEYTGKELTANGLGDITIGAKYRYGDIKKLQGMTSFYLKLPTGENRQFKDRQERLALGTGAYGFSINQSVSGYYKNVLLMANVGYTLNTKSDYTETNHLGANVKYENRSGNVFNYLVGAEFLTPVRRLVAYTNMAGVIIGRSWIKETYLTGVGINRDEEKKDRLQTLDLIAGVKFMVTEKTGLRLGFVAPVLTGYDPDVVDKKGRDWLLDFGFSGRF